MCSSILRPIMENNNNNSNYQGDLTDMIRASNSSTGAEAAAASYGTSTTTASASSQFHHQQHLSSVIEDYPIIRSSDNNNSFMFGDPFSTMRDPFLHELEIPPYYFNTGSSAIELEPPPPTFVDSAAPPPPPPNKVVVEDHDMMMMRSTSIIRPPPSKNIFSNMIQISPNNAPKQLLPYDSSSSSPSSSQAMAASATPAIKPNSGAVVNANKDCHLLDNNNNASLQISSPRNPGLKRRKNQAKKVVCIPAPAAANSRQTGEVVPSDLWAWRKYGQKPIKGSPYPRGYYRCSSSKGCSARKQVERSRTDPNMLVITYTSEHNHPWPTQRNALAGSTRSQPSKNNNTSNSSSKNSSETSQNQKGTTTPTKPKQDQINNNNTVSSPVISSSVKEEMEDTEKQLLIDDSMCDDGDFSDGSVLPNYKPSMMMIMDDDDLGNNNSNSDDFFAELGEIEADPLNLLFSTQGFHVGSGNGGDDQIQRESKALDPFNIFDWSGGGDTTNANSFEEHNNKGRL